jgi:hypothetical protein
VKDE